MPEVRVSEQPVCDFCSQVNPTREFACPDFPMDETPPGYHSRGAWMACSTCGTFIDHGKWEELLNRAVGSLGEKYSSVMPKRILREQVRKSHELFRQHWKGHA